MKMLDHLTPEQLAAYRENHKAIARDTERMDDFYQREQLRSEVRGHRHG